jgi:phage-related baseplate assembly protein
VSRVKLIQPVADVTSDKRHFPSCSGIELTVEVVA